MSVADVFHWIGAIKPDWYTHPQDWIGVHKVVSFLHAGFSTFALCLFASFAVANDG